MSVGAKAWPSSSSASAETAIALAALRNSVVGIMTSGDDPNPWLAAGSDGEDYHRRVSDAQNATAAEGRSPHGEANLVMTLAPSTVLDAGCGTGRVGAELSRRGVDVIGVDLDPSMLTVARREAPTVEWVQGDLAELDLGRTVDVVVAAGNVMVFLTPGTLDSALARLAAHLVPGGHLLAGWSLEGGPGGTPLALATYDAACAEGRTRAGRQMGDLGGRVLRRRRLRRRTQPPASACPPTV